MPKDPILRITQKLPMISAKSRPIRKKELLDKLLNLMELLRKNDGSPKGNQTPFLPVPGMKANEEVITPA